MRDFVSLSEFQSALLSHERHQRRIWLAGQVWEVEIESQNYRKWGKKKRNKTDEKKIGIAGWKGMTGNVQGEALEFELCESLDSETTFSDCWRIIIIILIVTYHTCITERRILKIFLLMHLNWKYQKFILELRIWGDLTKWEIYCKKGKYFVTKHEVRRKVKSDKT